MYNLILVFSLNAWKFRLHVWSVSVFNIKGYLLHENWPYIVPWWLLDFIWTSYKLEKTCLEIATNNWGLDARRNRLRMLWVFALEKNCWKDDAVIWQKATNHINSENPRVFKFSPMCEDNHLDYVWHVLRSNYILLKKKNFNYQILKKFFIGSLNHKNQFEKLYLIPNIAKSTDFNPFWADLLYNTNYSIWQGTQQ